MELLLNEQPLLCRNLIEVEENSLSENTDKIILFEQTPIPKAVAKLAIPTILSSLVMVLYNLADTYFVGMCNDPIQNAAVTLAAPVLLAFNAVNNLFGVGSSSMVRYLRWHVLFLMHRCFVCWEQILRPWLPQENI